MSKQLTQGFNSVKDSNAYINLKFIKLIKVLGKVLYIRLRVRKLKLFPCQLFIFNFDLQPKTNWTITF